MATLTGQQISATYKDLLQISNANAGIDATLRTVSDGEATDSVFYLSTTEVAAMGDTGIGTVNPDRLLHAEVSDAVTNAVTYAQRLSHITSNTAVAGFGTGIEFELEENDASNRVAAYITADWEDAGETASADGRLKFGVMTANAAAATAMSIWNGKVGVGTQTPTHVLDVYASTVPFNVTRDIATDGVKVGSFLRRLSDSPADGDGISFEFLVENDNDENIDVVGLAAILSDVSDGAEVGRLAISTGIGIDTASQTEVVSITTDGKVGIGAVTAPLAKLHIDQATDDAALPVLSLDQADISDGFINFIGATAASAAGPISSWTNATINGFVRAEVNGAQVWLATYNDPTS